MQAPENTTWRCMRLTPFPRLNRILRPAEEIQPGHSIKPIGGTRAAWRGANGWSKKTIFSPTRRGDPPLVLPKLSEPGPDGRLKKVLASVSSNI